MPLLHLLKIKATRYVPATRVEETVNVIFERDDHTVLSYLVTREFNDSWYHAVREPGTQEQCVPLAPLVTADWTPIPEKELRVFAWPATLSHLDDYHVTTGYTATAKGPYVVNLHMPLVLIDGDALHTSMAPEFVLKLLKKPEVLETLLTTHCLPAVPHLGFGINRDTDRPEATPPLTQREAMESFTDAMRTIVLSQVPEGSRGDLLSRLDTLERLTPGLPGAEPELGDEAENGEGPETEATPENQAGSNGHRRAVSGRRSFLTKNLIDFAIRTAAEARELAALVAQSHDAQAHRVMREEIAPMRLRLENFLTEIGGASPPSTTPKALTEADDAPAP